MGTVDNEIEHVSFAGDRLAYRRRAGATPTLLFLPGYASDMDGTKAVALDAWASRAGHAMVRFDYSGTGRSAGRFEEGSLRKWLGETLLVIDRLTDGPLVLVGSSMGGWLALLAALRRPERVQALFGIAAAPDFTDWGYDDRDKHALAQGETLRRDDHYGGDPQITTPVFWRSGQELRLLDQEIPIDCPVRLIHGDSDEDVPLEIAFRVMARLRSADVQLTIVKGGGHRLSQSNEIDCICRTVARLMETIP